MAARWAFEQAQGTRQLTVSKELSGWVERIARTDYHKDLELLELVKDKTFEPLQTREEEIFSDAKTSIEIMLPKVIQALAKKFKDRFDMRATQQKLKLYYYFGNPYGLETVALTLTLRGGKPLLWWGYIPTKVVGGSDFSKAIYTQVRVQDPEMAGLAMMRLLRELLAKID